MQYHQLGITEILEYLKVDKDKGLDDLEVDKRKKKHGANVLPRAGEKMTGLKLFFNQWKSPFIIILGLAAVISGFFKEWTDMTVILLSIGINVVVGFLQEYKANRALEQLREMVKYSAIVVRNGKRVQIPSEDLVPGDILYLEAGDKVQADGRIIQIRDFLVNESVLTGESEPAKKHEREIIKEAGLGDQDNMVFRGTIVTNGHALVVVTATGANTEIGQIADLVKETGEQKTPLQKQLTQLSKWLSIIVLFLFWERL
jgi:Ca2+-transporting ATPase